ncbi:TatD family hydrolase [Patescibacteria group bacterium]|nr:TatD family hydrolase [Patescibacteria group bacterium]
MIDTHCHLNFRAFKDDLNQVIIRALKAGVDKIINVGSQWDTSLRAAQMTNDKNNFYAAVGLHPIHLYEQEVDEEEDHFTTRAEIFNKQKYFDLAKSYSKVVAIGECGLDYYHCPKGVLLEELKVKQAELFWQQLELAYELNLPLIVHCREAYNDLLNILEKAKRQGCLPKGVAHCFLGNKEQAKIFLDLGYLLSFTGIITFKNVATELLEIVKITPLDKIMVETDAPYLAPMPYRGKRNEPSYVVEVAKKIADIKGISLAEVDKMTTKNAQGLFNLSK